MLVPQDQASSVPSKCWDKDSIIYLQYQCQQDEAGLTTKREEALLFTCMGIFICGVFLSTLFFLNKLADIDFKAWDVETVTAGDFTVTYAIPDEVWYNFEFLHEDKTRAEGSDFEEYLSKEFEKIVATQPSVLYPD